MRAWGSVGHYLQGPGIMDHAARYANLFGTKHLFVVDAFVRRMLGDSLFSEYGDLGGSSYDLVTFEGEISRGSIERVRREAGAGHDVIVAVDRRPDERDVDSLQRRGGDERHRHSRKEPRPRAR